MHWLPEFVAENSFPLSLKLRSSLLYNYLHTHDCPTNVVQFQRNILLEDKMIDPQKCPVYSNFCTLEIFVGGFLRKFLRK